MNPILSPNPLQVLHAKGYADEFAWLMLIFHPKL
jgi:hypothetical protein